MTKKLVVVVFAMALALGLVGCGASQQASSQSGDEELRVVATFTILGDLVENVGGDDVELSTLVGPNGDAHNFEPSPADGATLSEADLVFENGLQFETWLDDMYESSGSEAERVVVTEDIEPLGSSEEGREGEEHADEHGSEGEEHGSEGEEHSREHGEEGEHGEEEHADEEHGEEGHAHEHGEFDPHVWFDANNAVVMVESVRDALVEADPENAEAYERNAEEYTAELEELDSWVADRSANVPEEDRKLVTSHDTFGYFTEAYGYEVVGTGLPSFSTEASDPSAGETAELVEEIEASGVPAIFAENVSNPAFMERVANEANVELAPPLYTDALGEPDSEAGTYVEMMRYDTRIITEALGG